MNIAVYCGSGFGSDPNYRTQTEALGKWLAAAGHTLVYGGGTNGLMGIISRTVLDAGGQVFGVMPYFLKDREKICPNMTQTIMVDTMPQRKSKMIELADAFIALPGGPGTLEEISEVMSLKRLDRETGPCLFFNINGYYDDLEKFLDHMVEKEFVGAHDRQKFEFCSSLEEIQDRLVMK